MLNFNKSILAEAKMNDIADAGMIWNDEYWAMMNSNNNKKQNSELD